MAPARAASTSDGDGLNEANALLAGPKAIVAVKRPIEVDVAFAIAPGRCATLEGDVGYDAGDAILTGVKGEHWPVPRSSFLASYAPCPPIVAGADGPYVKRPATVPAVRLRQAIAVPVGSGDDLLHGANGDWLIRYGDGSYGIVSPEVFAKSYDIGDAQA
jgi:hypothetical protein